MMRNDEEIDMSYTYTTMIDVIKRIAEDDTPPHIQRQLNRLTSDERRKVRDLICYILYSMELDDLEQQEAA